VNGLARLVTSCERARLGPALSSRFVEIERDAELLEAVARLSARRHGTLKTIAQRALCLYLSDFDANAWLGMYPMHLLCTSHWRKLLGDGARGRLLDVGAGSGDVTASLAPLFRDVVTAEVSRGMIRRLRQRGFAVHAADIAESGPPGGDFDVVACLNVLDRCPKPRSLLGAAVRALAPGGRLVIALALPYRPFFYVGPDTPEPREALECGGDTFEEQVSAFVESEIVPLGVDLDRLARAPYLSAGDKDRELYELDDVLLVCRKPERAPAPLLQRR
jgi:SAM-dependent methyltransferase